MKTFEGIHGFIKVLLELMQEFRCLGCGDHEDAQRGQSPDEGGSHGACSTLTDSSGHWARDLFSR